MPQREGQLKVAQAPCLWAGGLLSVASEQLDYDFGQDQFVI